ncbi:MAG: RimK family protein [bacterium]
MKSLVVIENTRRWPLNVDGAEVVSARDYLTDPRFADLRNVAVFNLCRQYAYQSLGYYVSLLADARGHRAYPPVATLQGMREDALVRIVGEEFDDLVQRALHPLKSEEFDLSVYFGRNLARRYDRLSRALFNDFPLPFLRAHFELQGETWRLIRIRPIATADIPDDHREFVLEQARTFFARPRPSGKPRPTYRFDVAILWSPDDPFAPSDRRAVQAFEKAFHEAEMDTEVLGAQDIGRLGRFDALFIRENTAVEHHTYRFALRAAAEGLVVIDHPDTIIRCSNKVFQHESFRRQGIATPNTLLVHQRNVDQVESAVGFPCVLKKPDGTFSRGVMKVNTAEELHDLLPRLLNESSLIVAQAFTPSDYDWRIGILGGEPLWAARYHMVPGHWQIARQHGTSTRYGNVEAVPLEEAPPPVVDLALRASALMGNGLFGVDLKMIDGRPMVMEVNDNPNVEVGYEDAVAGEELYRGIARWFRSRLEERGRRGGRNGVSGGIGGGGDVVPGNPADSGNEGGGG